jgi:hypothetical protein
MPLDLDIDRLKNRTAKLDDDELLKIASTNAHEYQPVAVEVAKEELRRRGYSVEEATSSCGHEIPEDPGLSREVHGVPRKRWYQLFGLIFLAEEMIALSNWLINLRGGSGLTSLTLSPIGSFVAAACVFVISYFLSSVVGEGKRFKACCYLASGYLFFSSLRLVR